MVEIIKNMFRRKTRTLLTIFGITIGIFAFVVMGSMAEKLNLLVSGGTRYYADKVTVAASGGSIISLPTAMNISKAQEIAKVPGVAAVSSTIYLPLEESGGGLSFGPPPAIIGTDLKGDRYETFKVSYSSGRGLRATDRGKAVVGSDLVDRLHAKVGGTVRLRSENFEVVGILNKTLTAPDTEVWVTLPDAQQLLYGTLPEIIRSQTKEGEVVNGFTVYAASGTSPNDLASAINRQVRDVKALGPKEFEDQIANATSIFNAILFGVALISLLVGGLSIINTMTMSIAERIREIGIKKALGAKTRHIMAEYLTEAALIGLLGGIVGWGLGALAVVSINRALQDSGNVIFLLTLRISLIAIIFAVVLGVIAGIYPAYHAVRVNIVRALREV